MIDESVVPERLSMSRYLISFAIASVAVFGVWVGEGGRERAFGTFVVAVGVSFVFAGGSHPSNRCRLRSGLLVAVLVFAVGMLRSSAEWSAVDDSPVGPFVGEASVVGESKEIGKGRRVVLDIEDHRYETWVFGSKRHRVGSLEAGDIVYVEGMRTGIEEPRARRFHVRHIVGTFELKSMTTVPDSERRVQLLMRAANRIRRAIRSGAENLPADRAALFTGLVYGDDSSQPTEMVDRFRASGLAHLTAVSGQNVVFLLTMLNPISTRLRRPTRVALTFIVLMWFAIMTRLEPSVVRAVLMAGVSLLAVAIGRPVSSWVALCSTVVGATLVDPFLVWSVGWWLSVAGCVGLIVATMSISNMLAGSPRWVSSWIAPTMAAQTGVLGVIVAVFGWPSAMSVPSNLLAAPVAGAVMLVGLPVAMISGMLPEALSTVAMWPIGVAVAWVDSVAGFGARLDAPEVVDVGVAVVLACVVVRAVAVHGMSKIQHA